jgi:hypothetical protein
MYLGLAITGIAYYLGTRTAIYDSGDAAATLANITSNKALAHLDLALQLGIVVFQSLAAFGFYKLLRPLSPAAAWGVGVFGTVNAALILFAAAAAATAVGVAMEPSLAIGNDTAGTVQLLYYLGEQLWGVGAIFFGLWLIPMGWAVLTSRRTPKALGWILIISGVGYIASAFVAYGVSDAPSWLVDGLTAPATIGEFWIIGYLLVKGLNYPLGADDRGTAKLSS